MRDFNDALDDVEAMQQYAYARGFCSLPTPEEQARREAAANRALMQEIILLLTPATEA